MLTGGRDDPPEHPRQPTFVMSRKKVTVAFMWPHVDHTYPEWPAFYTRVVAIQQRDALPEMLGCLVSNVTITYCFPQTMHCGFKVR